MKVRLFGVALAVGVTVVGATWLARGPGRDRVERGGGLQPGARDLRGGDHFAILKRGPACVEKDLTIGRFRVGSDFNELCKAWPPDVVVKHDRYVTAVYGKMGPEMFSYDHTYVSAEDGKLFYATGGGCVWGCVFFSTLAEPDEGGWGDSFHPAAQAWQVEQRANYRRRLAALGAAGPAAVPLHPETWGPR